MANRGLRIGYPIGYNLAADYGQYLLNASAVGLTYSGAASVNLAWSAPSLNEEGGAADVASYTVQYGAYEGDFLGQTTGITSTNYDVALLAPSGTWWFQVIAVSSTGAQSLIGTPVQKTIP